MTQSIFLRCKSKTRSIVSTSILFLVYLISDHPCARAWGPQGEVVKQRGRTVVPSALTTRDVSGRRDRKKNPGTQNKRATVEGYNSRKGEDGKLKKKQTQREPKQILEKRVGAKNIK